MCDIDDHRTFIPMIERGKVEQWIFLGDSEQYHFHLSALVRGAEVAVARLGQEHG